MAMNAATLGASMASAVGVTDAAAQASFVALAGAIITHITSNATVTVATTIQAGSIATGVTAGAAAVPVTGTATGTGTIA